MRTIRELRVERNLTQQELAEMIGVTKAAVSQYERGERIPRYLTMRKISHVLETSLGDIFFGNFAHDLLLDGEK